MRPNVLRSAAVGLFVVLLVTVAACVKDGGSPQPPQGKENTPMPIALTSPSFLNGTEIPTRHTCDGADASPSLSWTGVPERAKSLALICDDPDAPAGTWVHWVIYAIPPTTTALGEGVTAGEAGPGGALQGTNDFRRLGYGGPCPPAGRPHRYFFKLYALDASPELPAGATQQQLLAAMEGHILGQGELMGTYQRR